MSEEKQKRNPTDYSKTQIYKLCCKDPYVTEIYVGSTTDKYNRKISHKSCCNNPNSRSYNNKVYQYIRASGGFDNWDLVVIEDYPCKNKNEKLLREKYWLNELKATLNSYIPMNYQTGIVWDSKQYRKSQYAENRECEREYHKEWRAKNPDYFKQYYAKNPDYFKQYYAKNRDKINEYRRREYRKKQ